MIEGINHITFAVSDLERSFTFYHRILGLKPVLKWKSGAYFLAGKTWLALHLDERVAGLCREDYSHIAFSCAKKEFDELKARILSSGTPEWAKNISEGESLYFCDPDGHQLEIHVGDLASRLRSIKASPLEQMEVFPE